MAARSWSRPAFASVLLSAVLLCNIHLASAAFSISAVQERPTWRQVPGVAGVQDPYPPIETRNAFLSNLGYNDAVDSSVRLSKFLYVGCFLDISGIGPFVVDDTGNAGQDPTSCLEQCFQQYPDATRYEIVMVVQRSRCGCIPRDLSTGRPNNSWLMTEAEATNCVSPCPFYQTELCGGDIGTAYWGLFMEYDLKALTGQGAFDPWTNHWYSCVIIQELTIEALGGGTFIPETKFPHRYYLHAVKVTDGAAQFPYQMNLGENIMYGLQFDLDSNRLVGLQTTGGLVWDDDLIRRNYSWGYRLAVIQIENSVEWQPSITLTQAPLFIPAVEPQSEEFLAMSGASAILSRDGMECYIFTQVHQGFSTLPKDLKDRMYFVRIPDGFIIASHNLDFKAEQIFANEKHGWISALGPRLVLAAGEGRQQYVYLGRVFFDSVMGRTEVEWTFDPINTQLLTLNPAQIEDYKIYPGVNTNDHLGNKSAIAHRTTPIQDANWHTFLITEVRINGDSNGLVSFWCGNTCDEQGTMNEEIPYAGIYNREPGIPLSLGAPQLSEARFTMSAGTIVVIFDRPTNRGATPIYADGNPYVPIDYDNSTIGQGEFNCDTIWDELSVELLGPYSTTTCVWMSPSQLNINLPTTINISVGDSIQLLENKIYAIPLNGEHSPASTGGVQIFEPDPLEDPVILLAGPTRLDDCMPVSLSLTDTQFVGGLPTYEWTFVNETIDFANPRDLTNNPERTFDPALIESIRTYLAEATAENRDSLNIPSTELEPAATYRFELAVTSRWGRTTSRIVDITRLSFSAPSVYIDGAQRIERLRTDEVTLEAIGSISDCIQGTGVTLGYNWIVTSDNLDLAALNPPIVTDGHILVIRPEVLVPGDPFIEYNFTVECFIDTVEGRTPERTATAMVTVVVRRSELIAAFTRGSRLATIGDLLVLDARASEDPDYPTQGLDFEGTFTWYCLTPDPANLGREPCYGDTPADNPEGVIRGITLCRQDLGTQIQDGGVTFFAPLFDDLDYCRYARGVLMLQTTDFQVGEYKFSVKIETADGRTGETSVFIRMTDIQVPQMVLSIANAATQAPQGLYPTTQTIRITGTEQGTLSQDTARTYGWEVATWQDNPLYDAAEAEEREGSNNPYTVDPQIFVVTGDDVFDQNGLFRASVDSPNLVILPCALGADLVYRFRLSVNVGTITGYEDIQLETAGQRPRPGTLVVDPLQAPMDQSRKLTANEWTATDLPMSFHFGQLKFSDGNSVYERSMLEDHFTASPTARTDIELDELALGEAPDYNVLIFVDVFSLYGAQSRAGVVAVSGLPDDTSQAVTDGLDQAGSADPGSVVDELQDVSSLLGQNGSAGAAQEMIDILAANQDSIPPTESQYNGQLDVINAVIGAGETGDNVLALLENVVTGMADNTGISAGSGNAIFNAIGNLMPGDSTGQRRRLRELNESVGPMIPTMASRRSQSEKLDIPKPQRRPPGRRLQVNVDLSRIVDNCGDADVVADRIPRQCEIPNQFCIPKCDMDSLYRCCSVLNPEIPCTSAPCWVKSNICPPSTRRLTEVIKPSVKSKRELRQHGPKSARSANVMSEEVLNDYLALFKSPVEYEYARNLFTKYKLSDWERISKHHEARSASLLGSGARRLQASTSTNISIEESSSLSDQMVVQLLDGIEEVPLRQAQLAVQASLDASSADTRADAREEVSIQELSPVQAQRLREELLQQRADEAEALENSRYESSQRMTVLNVLRDITAKELIKNLVSNEAPLTFRTPVYSITIGKVTNLDTVPGCDFPEEGPLAPVRPDAPDEPTPDNPVTGFAFVYIEYQRNVYSWAESTPESPRQMLITLLVLQANTGDLANRQVPYPIRVHNDHHLFSSAVCYQWDRFAVNTPGGAWSTSGVVNDEKGCLTTITTVDILVTIDGTIPNGHELVDAAATWEREVWQSTCIGCGSKVNSFVLTVLGMLVFAGILLVLMGYVMDETRRSDMAKGKQSRYYFDGDGLTSPMHVDDPIAYSAGDNKVALVIGTFTKVCFREHIVLSPLFYHETFTRPQRILCIVAMIMGLLAMNSAFQSHPGYAQEAREYFVPGILSGLLVFPIFVALLIMFNLRPAPVKRRLIKRQYPTREIDLLAQQRAKHDHTTTLAPPQGYMQLTGPQTAEAGGSALLAMPGSSLLRPLPKGMPPLPGGGAAGLTSLPALPGMSANMPMPPLPRYPPPPKNAKVPGPPQMLPPITFPKAKKAPLPLMEASKGGTPVVPPPPLPDTGATPLQLPPLQSGPPRIGGGTPPAPGTPQSTQAPRPSGGGRSSGGTPQPGTPTPQGPPVAFDAGAAEAPPPPGAIFQSEGEHSMAPPGPPSAGPPPTPPKVPAMPTPTACPGSFTPPGMATPNSARSQHTAGGPPAPGAASSGSLGGAGAGTPPPPPPGGTGGRVPPPPPPGGLRPASAGSGGEEKPVFLQGLPPLELQAPHAKAPGMPPMPRSRSGTPPTSTPQGAKALSPASTTRPPPPPPPNENNQAYIRRAGLTLEKARGPGAANEPAPLFLRGLPPAELVAPHTKRPPSMPPVPWMMSGQPPTALAPNRGKASGMPFPSTLPPPPPPPKEDDQAFIRRVKLTYMDKVIREHEKTDLLEDTEQLGKGMPTWAYSTMTLMPYLACTSVTVAAVFIVMAYGQKFEQGGWQEEYWYKGSLIGLVFIISVGETFRLIMLTLVELRKFENRKKAKAGHFLPRRVKKDGATNVQEAPRPRLWANAVTAPPVPKAKAKAGNLAAVRPLPALPGLPQLGNV